MIRLVSGKDYLCVSFKGLFADYDKDTLTNLYEPIIGYDAYALYLTLLSETKYQEVGSMITHEAFTSRIKMNLNVFIDAKEKLEGIGLIKTYEEDSGEFKIYHYVLYPPRLPNDFFDNPLYYGLLKQNVGDKEAERIKELYIDIDEEINGEEVSASFKEVYHPDLDSKPFSNSLNFDPIKGRATSHVNDSFSYEDFYEACSQQVPVNTITEKSFSKEELKEIRRIASLYGANEYQMAYAVNIIFKGDKPKGERVNSKDLRRQLTYEVEYVKTGQKEERKPSHISSNSELASEINAMEDKAPIQYLQDVQKGVPVADADQNLIDTLSSKYQLPNSVINALISYTLKTQHNSLPPRYMEKIASNLVRQNCKSAVDTMEYLNQNNSKSSSKKSTTSETTRKNDKMSTSDTESEKKKEPTENWKNLFGKNDGGK